MRREHVIALSGRASGVLVVLFLASVVAVPLFTG